MLNQVKRKISSHTKPQKIDRAVLMSAMDEAIDSLFGDGIGRSDVDELIAKTGKSRQEILSTCLADDEIDACREDLESALIAREWRIYEDVAEDGKPQVDIEIINNLYKAMRHLVKDLARLAVLAKFNGFAIAEYIYRFDETMGIWVIDSIKSKEGELDKFSPKRDGTVLFNDGNKDIAINQEVKCLVLKSRAVPARPMGEMMIIKAYPAVVLRAKGWAYAGQFIARHAQPYIIGKQGDTILETAMSFVQKIYNFLNGGAAGIGKDDDIIIHQLNGDGEAFERFERLCNRRIQKLLLGRVKLSELNNGSRAANETEDEVRDERIAGYLTLMSEAMQHAIDAMLAVNDYLGTPINAPEGLWFEYVSSTQVDKERAERDKIYTDTGLITFTEDYFVDIVGLEKHHFKMVDAVGIGVKDKAGQDKDGLPLSIQLSNRQNASDKEYGNDNSDGSSGDKRTPNAHQQHDHDHNHDDDTPLTAKQAQISQTKTDAILSILGECTDFLDFEKRLQSLTLPDGGMINELANQNLQSYVDGVAGVVNGQGEYRG